MIIRSIRLKRIKSYGEGPDGTGVVVGFQPGVNRVAGRNGHGKTTLIEALGYALFSAEPVHEEGFRLPTYFLRAGEKEGEIDVIFEHAGECYRLERGLGQSKRRTKVIQLSDGSTCALDDAEVSAWLCRLLGFKDQGQLADLFSNLVGVKQGRLTWPFDSKPAAAKTFFEPLLDVAVFRESTSRLADALGRFKESLQEQENKLSGPQARLQFLADSQQKVPIKQAEVEAWTRTAEKSRKQREQAEAHRKSQEQKQAAFTLAKAALEEANHQLALATQKRLTDLQRVEESREAFAVVQRSEHGYQAFIEAENRLRVLQERQTEQSALEKKKAEISNSRTKWETKQASAVRQVENDRSQLEERTQQANAWRQQLAQGRESLQQTQAESEALQAATETARRAWNALEEWSAGLPAQREAGEGLAAEITGYWTKIQGWDPQTATRARAEEQQLDQAARGLGQALAKAEEAKNTLEEQLRQIGGGVCPFLKEKCRQFDPKAVQSDLGTRQQKIREIGQQLSDATAAHTRARKNLEKLVEEERETVRLKNAVADKLKILIERHNNWFPAPAQKYAAVVHSYLSIRFELKAPSGGPPSSFWTNGQEHFDASRLEDLRAISKDFCGSVSSLMRNLLPQLSQRFAEFETRKTNRVRALQDLENRAKNLEVAEQDLKRLSVRIEQSAGEARQAETQAKAAAACALEVDEKLAGFADLPKQLLEAHKTKETNEEHYRRYLGAKPLFDKLPERQSALEAAKDKEVQARAEVRQRKDGFELITKDLDPAALDQARSLAAEAGAKLASDERALESAERELKQEKERLDLWKQACLERDRIQTEIDRLRAASELAKLAGKVLKAAAPAVAQHLCSRIAANAQRIFNQINQEAIELEWKAEPQYSLRVIPGDRRFAMLSGGEQTKLALAMTLAMIQQFSGLRFAVFDEPTYAVDAESREKLADAIIEAQKAAGLDQLIIVSHDDAFEGKIEHVVLLNKHAGSGTSPG